MYKVKTDINIYIYIYIYVEISVSLWNEERMKIYNINEQTRLYLDK